MSKKKRISAFTPEELAEFAKSQRKLAERIAYHERKIEEEKAAREAQSGSES
jgi:hypothetical protein